MKKMGQAFVSNTRADCTANTRPKLTYFLKSDLFIYYFHLL